MVVFLSQTPSGRRNQGMHESRKNGHLEVARKWWGHVRYLLWSLVPRYRDCLVSKETDVAGGICQRAVDG